MPLEVARPPDQEDQPPIQPAPKKPTTLMELLAALTEADEALETADFDQQIDLLEQGRIKIDNYKFILDRLKARELLLKEWIEEYSRSLDTIKKNRERLQKHLLFAMQTHGFTQFSGQRWVVKITRASPSVQVTIGDADSDMKIKYDRFVRVKYEWNKDELRDALKADDPEALALASLQESLYPRISLNKKIDEDN